MTYRARHAIKVASEKGKRMARARWNLDREKRNRLAASSPEYYPSRIMRRIVVIDDEREAREVVIYESDSMREARQKLRKVLNRPGDGMTKKCPKRYKTV